MYLDLRGNRTWALACFRMPDFPFKSHCLGLSVSHTTHPPTLFLNSIPPPRFHNLPLSSAPLLIPQPLVPPHRLLPHPAHHQPPLPALHLRLDHSQPPVRPHPPVVLAPL